jgi:hypothetical protein
MNERNFTTSILVDQTPEEAFDAINDVRGWWSEGIEGHTEKLGDEFTFQYKDIHRSTQKLTEVVRGKKVVWLVSDAHLGFTRDKSEWKGTHVIFEVSRKRDKTEVRFTHEGLVPECECFEACSKGWSFFIHDSLRGLITTGRGQPAQKESSPGTVRRASRATR